MKFERQKPPRKYKHWRSYRKYTREDFQRFCAYCFRHEDEAGGEDAFVQDHFEPRSINPGRATDYTNLYWCCVGCNAPQNKDAHWPSAAQMRNGEGFCDPCVHDPFGQDYEEKPDGRLRSISQAGDYTIRHIGLNRRRYLVNTRLDRHRVRSAYIRKLGRLRKVVKRWTRVPQGRLSQQETRLRDLANRLLVEYERFVLREPFVLAEFPPPLPKLLA